MRCPTHSLIGLPEFQSLPDDLKERDEVVGLCLRLVELTTALERRATLLKKIRNFPNWRRVPAEYHKWETVERMIDEELSHSPSHA